MSRFDHKLYIIPATCLCLSTLLRYISVKKPLLFHPSVIKPSLLYLTYENGAVPWLISWNKNKTWTHFHQYIQI